MNPEPGRWNAASRYQMALALALACTQLPSPFQSAQAQGINPGGFQQAGQLGMPNYLAPGSTMPPPPAPSSPIDSFSSLQSRPEAGIPYLGMGASGAAPEGFGLRWETGEVTFGSSVSFTYTDNALLLADASSDDLIIFPSLSVTFSQQIGDQTRLSLNLGVGYRYSLNYADLSQVNALPNGAIDYSFVVGDTVITLFDRISGSTISRQELTGNGLPSGVDFNRFGNQIGVSARHALTEDTSITGQYGFSFERGISDEYSILDRDTHSLSTGAFHQFSPYWTGGLTGQLAFTSFPTGFQNDSTSYGGGPMISFRPSEFITASVGLQYTIATFKPSGQIQDTREFAGLTYQGSITHVITPTLSHSAMGSSGINTGIGSNFTETLSAGYHVTWRFVERMALNFNFQYSRIEQSMAQSGTAIITVPTGTFLVPVTFIANDIASIYDFTLSTGYQLTDRANLGLNLTHSIRDSRFSSRSFNVNTVTLSVNYRF